MVGCVVGEHAHIVDVLLRGFVDGLEKRIALGQVAHGAHGLVPHGDFAGVAQDVVELGKRAVLDVGQARAAEDGRPLVSLGQHF
jgi:hypothetical protein